MLKYCITLLVMAPAFSAGGDEARNDAYLKDIWTSDSLLGDWAGPRYWPELRDGAIASGIHPFAFYTTEVFGNVNGGAKRGAAWAGVLDFGVGIDLETFAGVKGGSLFLAGEWIEGENPTEKLVGDFNAVSNIAGFDTVRFLQGWYGQSFGEAWTFRVGMLALDDDFMVSDAAGLFLNSAFGPLPTQSGNVGAPIWPLSAPGGFVQYEDPRGGFFQFGLYDGDAGEESVNDHGLRISLDQSEGAMAMAEGGLASSFFGQPGAYKLGAYYHSGDFEDFASGGTENGTYSLYFVADQTLWQGGESQLVSFWRAGWNPREDRTVVTFYTDFGLNWEGIPGRPADTIGLAYSHAGFGDDYVAAQRAVGENVSSREGVLELTYRAAITPWWIVQPDVQWVFDPHESRNDALLLGVRTQIIF
ncbi:MAG: carbohydrate porin [Opitutales bacterium]